MRFGKRTHKPNSVYAVIPLGAALPRTLISDLPGGFDTCSNRLAASGRCAAGVWLLAPASLPIWSCSVWGLPCHSHYWLRGALLPHLFTLTTAWSTTAWRRPLDSSKGLPHAVVLHAMAVCFLWHWPSTGLEARVPDVIRHTALRSSDFPLPATPACARISGSDRPVLLPVSSVPRIRFPPTYLRITPTAWAVTREPPNQADRGRPRSDCAATGSWAQNRAAQPPHPAALRSR